MIEQDLNPVSLTPKSMLLTEKEMLSPAWGFRVLTCGFLSNCYLIWA